MTDRKTTNGELDLGQFQTLVETFGADRRRWPETSRDAARNFLVQSSAALEALAQARALDRLLATEDGITNPANSTLIERIVAAAAQQPSNAERAITPDLARTVVVPLGRRGALRTNRIDPANPAYRGTPYWHIASALAASLILGVALGTLDAARAPLRGLAEITSTDTEVDQFVAALHSDALTTSLDEDH